MPALRILILTVCVALAFGGLFPLEGKAAATCTDCAAGLHQSGDCQDGAESMPCQPCLGGCVGKLIIGTGATQASVTISAAPEAATLELASLVPEPSPAPPRP